jgi:hypothetical protein
MIPRHHLGLTGATTVDTGPFRLTKHAVRGAVRRQGIAAVTGDAGLGKTYAAEDAFAEFSETLETCLIVLPGGRPHPKRVAQLLLRELTGVSHEASRFELADDLIEILSQRPRLIGVDEAQNGYHAVFEFLRHLHDDPRTTFALVLIGGHGAWRVLSRYPMLRSRIRGHVEFHRWRHRELFEILAAFHEFYAEAPKELLLEADERLGRGNFREWVNITVTAMDVAAEFGYETLTREVLDTVLALAGGKADAA